MKDFFQSNKVRAVKVVLMKNERGQSKGTAIIEFSSAQDAEYVVKSLNGVDLENRQVYFEYLKQSGTPSASGGSGGQGYSTGGFRGGASGGGRYYSGGQQ